MILLDPLDERLHRVAAPILHRALAERDELNELLLKRGKELEHAGYAVQVNVTSRSTVLFSLCGGQRQVISSANGQFVSGQKSAPRDVWLREIETEPQCFSPNAIFRPVVQDYLLPTVAYFGGPAEIAYYAQSQVLYEKLLGRMPVILPRADFTLVDPKAMRILKKYGLQVEDAWQGKQQLLKRMHSTNVPKKLAREFDSNLRQLEKSLHRLHKAIAKVDPTIQGTIARAEKRIRYQIEKLRQKRAPHWTVRKNSFSNTPNSLRISSIRKKGCSRAIFASCRSWRGGEPVDSTNSKNSPAPKTRPPHPRSHSINALLGSSGCARTEVRKPQWLKPG